MNKECLNFTKRDWELFHASFEDSMRIMLNKVMCSQVFESMRIVRTICQKYIQEIAWLAPEKVTSLSVKEIATIYDVSTRTIYRCLRKLAKNSNYTITDKEFDRWIIMYRTIQELSRMIRKTGKYKQ